MPCKHSSLACNFVERGAMRAAACQAIISDWLSCVSNPFALFALSPAIASAVYPASLPGQLCLANWLPAFFNRLSPTLTSNTL